MNQQPDRSNDGIFVTAAIMILIMVGVPAIYAANSGSINGFLLAIGKQQLKAFVPFSDEAQTAWAYISQLDPKAIGWDVVEKVMYYTGKWVRWPFAVILCLLGAVSLYMGRTGKLVRKFNMGTLLANNAETFPCLRPIVGRGKTLLDPKSYDKGLWMVARTPLQFALENGLLLDAAGNPFAEDNALKNGIAVTDCKAFGNGHLDEAKTIEVMKNQLGKAWEGFAALTPCRKAIAAALISYANGDKKGSVAILDEVSTSYQEKDGQASCPVLETDGFAKRIQEAWDKHSGVLKEACMTRHTAFELPFFMALLYRARQKGVLASSQFLWLRPMDRPLWYALNQCGGRAAWAEAFAAWSHYTAEERAKQCFADPQVSGGFKSLRSALDEQGWLADKTHKVETPASETPSGSSQAAHDRIYAPAESDPEYDAETDPYITGQQI